MASNKSKNNLNSDKNLKEKNKVLKIIMIALILIIIFVLCFLIGSGYFSKERRLTKSITILGDNFYKDFYYDKISNKKSSKESEKFLKQFEDAGIVVSLYNIKKYNSKNNEKYLEELENAKCDKYKTTVTIYPKSPYEKENYEMKVTLDCKNLK